MLTRYFDFPSTAFLWTEAQKGDECYIESGSHIEEGASTPNADQKSVDGFGLPVTTGGWPSKVDSVLCGQAGGPDI